MRIETISTLEEMKPYETEWNEAVSRSSFDSVFATYEWFSAWIRNFAKNKTLKIVVAHEYGRLLGILPLRLHKKILGSLSNLQTFKFNFILPIQGASSLFKYMMDYLTRTTTWDSMHLDFMPDNPDPIAFFRESGCRAFSEYHMLSPYLEIEGPWESYWAQRSERLKKNLNYCERLLEREGAVRMRRIESGDFLEEHVRTAFDIEQSSWKGKNGTAIACSEDDRGFYLDLARSMCGKNRFMLYFLECREKRIAFSYCLQYKNRLSLLKTGYSPEFARCSPGMVLQRRIIEDLFRHRQDTVYDFLGARDDWKTKWTNRVQPLCRISAFNSKFGPALLYNALMARENCKNSIRRYPTAFQFLKRSQRLFRSEGDYDVSSRHAHDEEFLKKR